MRSQIEDSQRRAYEEQEDSLKLINELHTVELTELTLNQRNIADDPSAGSWSATRARVRGLDRAYAAPARTRPRVRAEAPAGQGEHALPRAGRARAGLHL